MKKDFSQPFVQDSAEYALSAALIIKDLITGNFVAWTSVVKEINEEDFHSILTLDLKTDQELDQQLAKGLYQYGIVLSKYRELIRLTEVEFSFIDDTPGSKSTHICFYIEADIPDIHALDEVDARKKASLVTLPELLEMTFVSPLFSKVTHLGIAQLVSENRILGE